MVYYFMVSRKIQLYLHYQFHQHFPLIHCLPKCLMVYSYVLYSFFLFLYHLIIMMYKILRFEFHLDSFYCSRQDFCFDRHLPTSWMPLQIKKKIAVFLDYLPFYSLTLANFYFSFDLDAQLASYLSTYLLSPPLHPSTHLYLKSNTIHLRPQTVNVLFPSLHQLLSFETFHH